MKRPPVPLAPPLPPVLPPLPPPSPVTVTVPRMPMASCGRQKYAKVPGVLKVYSKVCPGPTGWSNSCPASAALEPVPEVTVCATVPSFIQRTVVPAVTLVVAGSKAIPAVRITTAEPGVEVVVLTPPLLLSSPQAPVTARATQSTTAIRRMEHSPLGGMLAPAIANEIEAATDLGTATPNCVTSPIEEKLCFGE